MSRNDDTDGIPAAPPGELAAAAALDAEGRRAVDAEDYPAARAAFERELALRRQLDDAPGIIYALIHVAWVWRVGLGDVAAACPPLEEALAIARERSPELVAVVLCNLGDQALADGEFETASRLLRECLVQVTSVTRDAGTVGAILESLAMAAAGQGQSAREREQAYVAAAHDRSSRTAEERVARAEVKALRHFAILRRSGKRHHLNDLVEATLMRLGTRVLWIDAWDELPERLGRVYAAGTGARWQGVYGHDQPAGSRQASRADDPAAP